jgi:hypothetical protein
MMDFSDLPEAARDRIAAAARWKDKPAAGAKVRAKKGKKRAAKGDM